MDFDKVKENARLIAFYLPQFHPIPENDAWWGRGFTEWRNVCQAKPLFREHYQPRLPADLGFYDLRVPETRAAQAELAREYGIEGFCYWHYWFQGRRLLWRPFNDVLQSGEPDFPFCLAWANESWSRRWLGEEKDVLIAQAYSDDDDMHHIQWLLQAFADRRHITINGRPLFLIYRPRHLPNPQRTTDLFRTECVKAGLPEPFLVGIDAHCQNLDCRSIGFDGTLSFEPQLGILPGAFKPDSSSNDGASLSKLMRNLRLGIFSSGLKIYDDEEARRLMFQRKPEFPYYPSIFVGWDNTPRRRENAIVVINGTPDRFAEHLSTMIRGVANRPFEDRLVFINAWNEWAEGNYLEPDLKWGCAYLRGVGKAVSTASSTHGSVVGTSIQFNAGGNSEKYRVSGWSQTEEEFTWSEGKSAQLALPIPSDSGGLTLVIKMGALVNRPAVPYQVVEVLANGQKIADWEVADMADFSALIPGEVTRNKGILNIELRVPKATSPKVLGLTDDSRMLGVSVYSVELKRP